MGITYTTEYNGARTQKDLGNTSLGEAFIQAARDIKNRAYDTVSFKLTDGTGISYDEILYLITHFGGFPKYNSPPRDSSILQTLRSLRENKRKNIGIMYRTEYNGTKRQFHFVGTCLMDVLRQVADDFRVRNYDTVSLTLEDRGMVITNDELERITKSYMGFPKGLERTEASILDDIERLQQEKQKDRNKQAENQQRLKQARVTVRNMIASGQIRTPVINSWFELNPTEMAIEDQKKWAIVEYHLDGKLSFKFYIDGEDQILSARSREEAEEVMAKLISGIIERR